MKLTNLTALIFMVLFLHSCAEQAGLTGGEKDMDAPKIVNSFPGNYSVNHNENTVWLEFDEFIQIQNAKKDIIVSPLIEEDIDYQIRGKKLIIKFPKLDSNTTYEINFGEVVKDITENNPLDSNRYVFSTGKTLDSSKYQGKIIETNGMTASEGYWVGLYEENDPDSIAIKRRGKYLTKANSNGVFSFNNVKDGTYRLIAFKDANANNTIDPNEESFGQKTIQTLVADSIAEERIFCSKQRNLHPQKNTLWHTDHHISVLYEKEAEKSQIAITSPLKIERQYWEKDTLHLWGDFTNMGKNYLLSEYFTQTDTLFFSQKLDTTVTPIRIRPCRNPYQHKPKTGTLKTYCLEANLPCEAVVKDKIRLTLPDSTLIPFEVLWLDSSRRHVEISFYAEDTLAIKIQLDSMAFQGINLGYNQRLVMPYAKKDTGNKMAVSIQLDSLKITDNLSFIFQVIKGDEVIEEHKITGKHRLFFESANKQAGVYQMKMIIDLNHNGIRDLGDFSNKTMAEPILLFDGKLKLEKGFDLDQHWIITNKYLYQWLENEL